MPRWGRTDTACGRTRRHFVHKIGTNAKIVILGGIGRMKRVNETALQKRVETWRVLRRDGGVQGTGKSAGRMRKREIGILGGERAAQRLTQGQALSADVLIQGK